MGTLYIYRKYVERPFVIDCKESDFVIAEDGSSIGVVTGTNDKAYFNNIDGYYFKKEIR